MEISWGGSGHDTALSEGAEEGAEEGADKGAIEDEGEGEGEGEGADGEGAGESEGADGEGEGAGAWASVTPARPELERLRDWSRLRLTARAEELLGAAKYGDDTENSASCSQSVSRSTKVK